VSNELERQNDHKVLLIGGTSHVGKSAFAQRLAADLSWDYVSTDQLARHPGRPWRDYGSALPDDVAEHYANLSVSALTAAVLGHYKQNVWPIAGAMIRCRVNNPYDRCLVLEGSALLPELVAEANVQRVASIWITASEPLLGQRIHRTSRYPQRGRTEQRLIDAFLARAIAVDRHIREAAGAHGLETVDAETRRLFEHLRDVV
jgi:2-phosphoglycerate kinase